MILKLKAALSFIRLSVTEKIAFGVFVIQSLTENAATFPALPHSVASLEAKNNELHDAVGSAESGDHEKVAALHIIEDEWDDMFRDTANYVSTVADGNEETINKGGFTPTKSQSTPAEKPIQPNNYKVTVDVQQGSFTAKCEAIDNAKTYVYVSTPDGVAVSFSDNQMFIDCGDKVVCVVVDTHRLVHFDGMTGGVKQNVLMYAVNNAGIGTATAVQSVIPQ